MDANEHLRRLQWSAARWIADHQLLAEEYWDEGRGARWVIGQPDTNIHRCEILAVIFGSLIVHGDWDVCRFAYYGDHSDAWSRLRWMGRCSDLDYYVVQKATIGMGGTDLTEAYDEDVATHDLSVAADEADDDKLTEVLRAALDYTEDEQYLRSFLSDNAPGRDLWELTLGRVVAPRVVTAHAALARIVHLLEAKYGREGPPHCRRAPKGAAA